MKRAAAGPDPAASGVGPNAILQYLPVLEERVGARVLDGFLTAEQLQVIPDGSRMIEESDAARFHQAVRRAFPGIALELARRAGTGTAEYIIAHRIPTPARAVLGVLPRALAERMLCRSIASHAWTFVGSGAFTVADRSSIVFEIVANPFVRGEHSNEPICEWHAAVFERLFTRLVGRAYRVTETRCCASGEAACRFELQHLN